MLESDEAEPPQNWQVKSLILNSADQYLKKRTPADILTGVSADDCGRRYRCSLRWSSFKCRCAVNIMTIKVFCFTLKKNSGCLVWWSMIVCRLGRWTSWGLVSIFSYFIFKIQKQRKLFLILKCKDTNIFVPVRLSRTHRALPFTSAHVASTCCRSKHGPIKSRVVDWHIK